MRRRCLGAVAIVGGVLAMASCGATCAPDDKNQTGPETEGEDRGSARAKTVQLETSDGKTLAATLRRGGRSDAPAAILVHGLGSDRSEWDGLVRALSEPPGVTTLALDMRGHGDSEGGPQGWRKMRGKAWQTIGRDVVAAVDHLQSAPDLEPRHIVAVGASLGSSAVVWAAAQDERIDAVALLSPGRAYRGVDAIAPVRELGDRPLLALAGKGERHAARTAAEMARIAERGHNRTYDGNAHGVFMLPEAPELENALIDFIREPASTL